MRISIDGNIGASKSTVIASLAEIFQTSLTCYPEPLHTWGDLLRLFYEDPKTYALPFSLKVLLGFNASNDCPTKHCVVERSPLSCRHVFTQMLADEGTMTSEQFDVFKDYFDAISWVPDVILFIDTPAGVCMDRIEARGRGCETGSETCLDLQYIRRLEFTYEKMLKDYRVVRIDGTGTPEQVLDRVVSIVKTLI